MPASRCSPWTTSCTRLKRAIASRQTHCSGRSSLRASWMPTPGKLLAVDMSDRSVRWLTMEHRSQKTDLCCAILIVTFACAVTVAVFLKAWVSEDAFITFRYVANVLAGHGPVFNVGERVQGYTHPLWFILLC